MSLLFENYCLVEVTYQVDSMRPGSSHKTKLLLTDMVQTRKILTSTFSVKGKI